MNTRPLACILVGHFLLLTAGAYPHPALADFEVAAPDGRRILLRDDGTWRYIESEVNTPTDSVPSGEAVLSLERKIEAPGRCRFVVSLVNNLPYEIRSFVPHFSAYRESGVVYETAFARSAFTMLRPGDRQRREVQFNGIECKEIVRLQVGGGDRCVMGDLHKWSMPDGQCLARVRVAESDLVRFDQ